MDQIPVDMMQGGWQGELGASINNGRPKQYLFLYSPRLYGTQVSRPYVYAITDNGIDMLQSCPTMSESFDRPQIAGDPRVAGMIKPEANGTPMDMSVIGDLWTFVLQIDVESKSYNGMVPNRRRFLYSGVCLDEPVSMITAWTGSPTPNLKCPLRFTHMTEVRIDTRANEVGANTNLIVNADADIVDASLVPQAGSEMYIATPDRTLEMIDTASGINTVSRAALSTQPKGTGVLTTLKSPLAHLRSLLRGIDQQLTLDAASSGASIINPMGSVTDPSNVDDFKAGVVNSWSQAGTTMGVMFGSIEPDSVMILGQIVRSFPDIIIVPQRFDARETPQMRNGEVIDQQYTDPRTVYSSMAANAISAIATQYGFARIAFHFSNNVPQAMQAQGGEFYVYPDSVNLLVPPTDPVAAEHALRSALSMFEYQIKHDLVPTIMAAGLGPFELNASFMVNGETYVMLDFADSPSLSGGLFETGNRVGNVISPNIANAQQFMSNGASLDTFVHNVFGRHIKNDFGATAFGGSVAPNNSMLSTF